MKKQISQEYLKKLLAYDDKTGNFVWIAKRKGNKGVGTIANSKMKDGYKRITIDGKAYLQHFLAWIYVFGKAPSNQIDHINHDKSDNRICNLRDVTQSENQRNRRLNKNSTSGVCGVGWHKTNKIWEARIKINGKQKHIGSFKNFYDAVRARKEYEEKYCFHINHGGK